MPFDQAVPLILLEAVGKYLRHAERDRASAGLTLWQSIVTLPWSLDEAKHELIVLDLYRMLHAAAYLAHRDLEASVPLFAQSFPRMLAKIATALKAAIERRPASQSWWLER